MVEILPYFILACVIENLDTLFSCRENRLTEQYDNSGSEVDT